MRVITYGTFDTLHYGHILLLERARALGDYLIVGLSSDEFNATKGKRAHFEYEARKSLLQSLRCVDLIIPEHNWEQKRDDIVTHKADIFTIGDDWAGKFDDLSDLCEVKYLTRTPSVSSTLIRQHIVPAVG
ncbi:MAG: adenylyltransferase/cytidyltransferase family protein [Roseovarius sp.]